MQGAGSQPGTQVEGPRLLRGPHSRCATRCWHVGHAIHNGSCVPTRWALCTCKKRENKEDFLFVVIFLLTTSLEQSRAHKCGSSDPSKLPPYHPPLLPCHLPCHKSWTEGAASAREQQSSSGSGRGCEHPPGHSCVLSQQHSCLCRGTVTTHPSPATGGCTASCPLHCLLPCARCIPVLGGTVSCTHPCCTAAPAQYLSGCLSHPPTTKPDLLVAFFTACH